MFSFFSKLTKIIDNITIFTSRYFRWLAVVIMTLIVFEVVMRYIFNSPTTWGFDVMVYLSAGGRVFGFGYGCMLHSHVTMDLFVINLPFRKRMVLELITYFVWYFPLLLVLITVTWTRGYLAFIRGEKYYSVWRPYLWPALAGIIIAYALMIMQLVAEVIKDTISIIKGSDAWLKER